VPDLPHLGYRDEGIERIGSTASSIGTGVAAPGTANTKGAYVVLTAATTHYATAVTLSMAMPTVVGEMLLDLAIGPLGQEQDIISNVNISRGTVPIGWQLTRVPVAVPAGSRLTARAQSSVAGQGLQLTTLLHYPGNEALPPLARAEAIGVSTATSRGTAIDGGAAVNTTPATFTQLVASAARTYRLFYIINSNQGIATRLAANFLADIAIGAAGAEQVLVPKYQLSSNANEQVYPPVLGPFYIPIPVGSRVSARTQCSSSAAADRQFDVSLLGVY
jgi:hypothetical protein